MFTIDQAAVEVARLEATVAAAQVPGTDVDADDVQTWFDIVGNRIEVITRGQVGAFIAADPVLHDLAGQIIDSLQQARRVGEQPVGPEAAKQILKILVPANARFGRLTSLAHVRASEIAGDNLRILAQLQRLFSALITALISVLPCAGDNLPATQSTAEARACRGAAVAGESSAHQRGVGGRQ